MNNLIKTINKYLITNKSIINLKPVINQFNFNFLINSNSFEDNKYKRIKIYENNEFNYELLFLYWDKNSETPIHNHPKNGCIIKVLQGELLECRYKNDNTYYTNICCNEVSYIDDSIGTHKIIATEKSISVHLYSPSKFYDLK